MGVDKAVNKKYLQRVTTYSFKSGHYYFVEVELYLYDIYVVKYYLKKHKRNPLKYNLLTNEHKSAKVIATCIQIMLSIYRQNPKASFGFIGSATIDIQNGYTEPKHITKRFRVYRDAMIRLFGTETFTHLNDVKNSAYLMVNNKNSSVDDFVENAKTMFNDMYPDLERWLMGCPQNTVNEAKI